MCTVNNQRNVSGPKVIKPLRVTSSRQFVCEYRGHCFALCQCCHFFACDCRMQCPESCSCFHDSAWKHNFIECSNRDHINVLPLIPMDATFIFLDGNNFQSFLRLSFIGHSKVNSLFLNNSKIVIIGPKSFAGLSQLEILHLEGNWLEEIGESDFSNLTSLRELYLHDNKIFHIDQGALVNLSNLQVGQLLMLCSNYTLSFFLIDN